MFWWHSKTISSYLSVTESEVDGNVAISGRYSVVSGRDVGGHGGGSGGVTSIYNGNDATSIPNRQEM